MTISSASIDSPYARASPTKIVFRAGTYVTGNARPIARVGGASLRCIRLLRLGIQPALGFPVLRVGAPGDRPPRPARSAEARPHFGRLLRYRPARRSPHEARAPGDGPRRIEGDDR